MDDYTAEADKMLQEVRHFEMVRKDPDHALPAAKRVRRASTLLVRAIARHRDNVHTPEGDNE
jgi:hypothetical protein